MSGSDQFYFDAPRPLIRWLSASLDALTKVNTESGDASVNLDFGDKPTFFRFYQFVCTKTYDGLAPKKKESPLTSETETYSVDSPGKIESHPQMNASGLFGAGTTSSSANTDHVARTKALHSTSITSGSAEKNKTNSFRSNPSSARQAPYVGLFGAILSTKLPYSLASFTLSVKPEYRPPQAHLIGQFLQRFQQVQESVGPFSSLASEPKPELERLSYGMVFVAHARMWNFANKYGITTLMDEAQTQLASSLGNWMIFGSEFVHDFGSLVHFTFDGHSTENNALQNLVVQYAACVFLDVMELDGWRDLVEGVPTFATTLLHELGQSWNHYYK